VGIFTTINSTIRSQHVREQRERVIGSGVFEPGSRLPPEQAAAYAMRNHAKAVRNALAKWEASPH
jgi:DNA-binding FadR family transcriptional regulator